MLNSLPRPARLLLVLALLIPTLCAQTASGYRGPHQDGAFPAEGLLERWPEGGPKLLWKHRLGSAFSGATILGDRIYVSGGGGESVLWVLDLDGKVVSKIPTGGASWKRFPGTRSNPLVFGDSNTAITILPSSNCFASDLGTQKTRWMVNLWKNFNSAGIGGWGYPETPVVYGDDFFFNNCSRVLDTPGFVRVSAADGTMRWAVPGRIPAKRFSMADVSASMVRHRGRDLLFWPTFKQLLCIEPSNGRILWEIAHSGETTVTPVHEGSYLLWEPHGKLQMLRLDQTGSRYEILWTRSSSGGSYSQAVIQDGRVYTFLDVAKAGEAILPKKDPVAVDKKGEAAPPAPSAPPAAPPSGAAEVVNPGVMVACLDAETGKLISSLAIPELAKAGHIIRADGRIIAVTAKPGNRGCRVTLITPTAEGMAKSGSFDPPVDAKEDLRGVADPEWQTSACPLVAQGRLFLRFGPLFAYDLRANRPAHGERGDGRGNYEEALPNIGLTRSNNLAWTVPQGSGAPPVVYRRADPVLMAGDDGTLKALDQATGAPVWNLAVGTGAGRAATPARDAERIYALHAVGNQAAVVACDHAGKELWRQKLESSQAPLSLLVGHQNLIVQANAVQGLELATGKPVWKLAIPEGAPAIAPIRTWISSACVLITSWGAVVRESDGVVLGTPLPAARTGSVAQGDRAFIVAADRPAVTAWRLALSGGQATAVALWETPCPKEIRSPLVLTTEHVVLVSGGALGLVWRFDREDGQPDGVAGLHPTDPGAVELSHAGGRLWIAGVGSGKDLVAFETERGRKLEESWRVRVGLRGGVAFAGDSIFVRTSSGLTCLTGRAPTKPAAGSIRAVPPADIADRAGLPIMPFTDNTILAPVVVAGPYPYKDFDKDPLAAIGGRATGIFAAGDQPVKDDAKTAFRPIPADCFWTDKANTENLPAWEQTVLHGWKAPSTTCAFTVLANDKLRRVRFQLYAGPRQDSSRIRNLVLINGQETSDGDILELAPGRYRCLVQSLVLEMPPGNTGHIWIGPRFIEVPEAEYTAGQDAMRKALEQWNAYRIESGNLLNLSAP